MEKTATNYLKQGLALAVQRRGFCAPNPCVGAILVKNDQVIASGYHWASGYPHAEAEALNKIKSLSAIGGVTLYVTLQPCCHTEKKTPPCTELIIQRGVAKVVYGFRDPNPAVSGKTDKILKEAGIPCIQDRLPEIDRFYESYQFWWQHKRPFTTAKLAISLDGKITKERGTRIQLTGTIAQRFTHQQRKKTDAILTTSKTILVDNPLLNSRLAKKVYEKSLYVLDSQLKTPHTASILLTAKKITFFHRSDLNPRHKKKFSSPNIHFVPIEHDKEGLDLYQILQQIGQDGCHDLWIEAGGECLQSFAKNKLLQRAFLYVAPQWLGSEAQTAFTQNPFEGSQAPHLSFLGSDACFEFNWPQE